MGIWDWIGHLFKRPKVKLVAVMGRLVTVRVEGTDPLDVHVFLVDWGDGRSDESTDNKRKHTYAEPGTCSIRTKERCPWWVFITRWSKPISVTVT